MIKNFLLEHNINFSQNYILKDFDNHKSFDFKIDLQIGFALIEFDGIQHFEYNSFLHKNNIENFYKQQHYDEMKNQYCLQNNIPLLRIKYTECNNIENILINFINNYNKGSTTIQ